MIAEVGAGYYNGHYFDPGLVEPTQPRTSGYRRYGHSLTADTRFFLSAGHSVVEALGPIDCFRRLRVADLGGAKGMMASALRWWLPQSQIYNLDISTYATQNALPEVRQKTIQADIRTLPFPTNSFDLLLCLDVLEHLPEIHVSQTLNEIYRVLKPKGKAVLAPCAPVENESNRLDKSHICIKPFNWWAEKIQASGLVLQEKSTIKLARRLANCGLWQFYFPTLRPLLFIALKPKQNR
jgi:SAM-dependent methyltransferase